MLQERDNRVSWCLPFRRRRSASQPVFCFPFKDASSLRKRQIELRSCRVKSKKWWLLLLLLLSLKPFLPPLTSLLSYRAFGDPFLCLLGWSLHTNKLHDEMMMMMMMLTRMIETCRTRNAGQQQLAWRVLTASNGAVWRQLLWRSSWLWWLLLLWWQQLKVGWARRWKERRNDWDEFVLAAPSILYFLIKPTWWLPLKRTFLLSLFGWILFALFYVVSWNIALQCRKQVPMKVVFGIPNQNKAHFQTQLNSSKSLAYSRDKGLDNKARQVEVIKTKVAANVWDKS